MNLFATVRDIFLSTIEQVQTANAIRSHVRSSDGSLAIGELIYPMERFDRVMVVAIGKAALPMCETLLPILEPALSGKRLEGVAVVAVLPSAPDPRIEFYRGGHPTPDEISRKAADAILQLLAMADESTLVIFMVSGGASAMVEKPLNSEITVEEFAGFHKSLVRSGLPITQMNVLRKHFSQVKGGRLAVAAEHATQCTLLISDVPGEALDVVGSGPSLPDPSTVQDCLLIGDSPALELPPRVLAFFRSPDLRETPKADHPAFRKAAWFSLLSSDDLHKNASQLAEQAGFKVVVDNRCDDWDYRAAARYLIDRLIALHKTCDRACVISAGEVTVHLKDAHGAGGRNQQFVLECARILAEEHLSFTVLSGGSDGVDGNSPAAGAVCDGSTWSRAIASGHNPAVALDTFNSFPLFEALGDTIQIGPTGNNLRDLRILIADKRRR